MTPYEDAKCKYPHICSLCADPDHIATDPRCPKAGASKDWYVKRLNEVNRYYTNKSRKGIGYNNRNIHRGGNYQKYAINKPQYPPNHGPNFNSSNQGDNNRNERD